MGLPRRVFSIIIAKSLSGGESNSDRFSRAAFREYAENPLKIPTGIPFVILLVLPKSSSVKTAAHPTARIFALDFCADDAALLTQGKEDKEKYKKRTAVGLSELDSPLL